MKQTVMFKKLVPDAIIPKYATEGDSGMDLFASGNAVVKMGEVTSVSTGLACQLPPGYEFQVRPKSGLAAKHGVTVVNTPGTVDCGYRGEIKVLLTSLKSGVEFKIEAGMKIAQIVLAPVSYCNPVVVEEIDETERGTGGFGSTGS